MSAQISAQMELSYKPVCLSLTDVLNVKEMKRRNTHDSTWDILGHRPDACAKVGPLIARA